MRWTGIFGLIVTSYLMAGCGAKPEAGGEVLVRHHFVGLSGLAARSDLGGVAEVLALPESKRVVEDVARKLAVDLPRWYGGAAAGTNDAAALQPLVRALLDSESCLEVRANAGKVSGWALATRLDPSRVAGASGELRRVLGGVAAVAKAEVDFELPAAGGRDGVRVGGGGGWLVLGSGPGAFDAFLNSARAGAAPVGASSNAVLDVEADLAGLARILQWRDRPPGPVDQWPRVRLAVEARNGRLRTNAKLGFARPLDLPADAWQMPTNVLRDPLVGFTACQGAGTWIGRLGLFADLGVAEWPRQIFLWSLAGDPWQQYFAAPIQSPTNLMAQVSLTLPVRVVTNMLWNGTLFSLRITNQATRVEMHGIPYFAPFMEAKRTAAGEQLFGGLFTQAGPTVRPVPTGLLAQVQGRTNLVLYDWETTGRRLMMTNPPGTPGPRVMTNDIGRLIQFKHLAQFVRLMLSTNATRLGTTRSGELLIPGSAWIDAALPKLGDTVTEVTRIGPAELNLTRSSQIGFTALEIIYLLRWVDNPGFPGWVDVVETATARPRVRGLPPGLPGTGAGAGAEVVPAKGGAGGQSAMRSEAPRPTGAVPRVPGPAPASPPSPAPKP